jgi:hypothetical protein
LNWKSKKDKIGGDAKIKKIDEHTMLHRVIYRFFLLHELSAIVLQNFTWRLYAEGLAEIIRSGYGWVFLKYCTRPKCKEWEFIEAKAKDEKNGHWSMPNPIPPWEYRTAWILRAS